MPRTGFESAIPTTKRQHTYALDRAVTGMGTFLIVKSYKIQDLRKDDQFIFQSIRLKHGKSILLW
jgi:hypothetical protein